MSAPLLTIAIPTYNRAKELDRQLTWAVDAIAGRWRDVELVVSDNASPDDTPSICQTWQQRSGERVRVFRQPENLGLIRNALFCIEQAQGEYVWLVSDDDRIAPHTLDKVLGQLADTSRERLTFLHLNGNKIAPDGTSREGIYPFQHDMYSMPGGILFQKCVDIYEDWLMLITANVYATAAAKAAIQHWSGVARNWAFPLYLGGYAAATGAMAVCSDICLTDNLTYTRANWSHILYHDIPEAYWHLQGTGLSDQLIRRRIMMRVSFIAFAVRFPQSFLRSLRFYWRAAKLSKS